MSAVQNLKRTVNNLKLMIRPRPIVEYADVTTNQFLALYSTVDYIDRNKKYLMEPLIEEHHVWIINAFPFEMNTYLKYLISYNHPNSPYSERENSMKNFSFLRNTYYPALYSHPQVISHYLYSKKLYQEVDKNSYLMLNVPKNN